MEDSKELNNKEEKQDEPNKKGSSSPLFNIYDKIHISIKTLDIIIGVLALAIVVIVIYGVSTGSGFVVSYNTLGGTNIDSQKYEYGDHVVVNEPIREGYRFDYWALDETCNTKANLDTMIVDTNFTLYACWKEN